MREGDIIRRKTFLRAVYREMRLWPRIGKKPWTRKVLVVAHLEELTRAVMVAPTGLAGSVLLIRFYVLLQAYASLQFKPLGRWRLKIARSS